VGGFRQPTMERRDTRGGRLDHSTPSSVPSELEEIYARQRLVLEEQLSALEEASAAALLGELSDEQRSDAKRYAHKMAGAAGMFGFPSITPLAREMEDHLGDTFHEDADLPRRLAILVVELRKIVEAGPQFDPDDEWSVESELQSTLAVVSNDARLLLRLNRAAEELGFRIERDTTSTNCTAAIVDLVDAGTEADNVSRFADSRPSTPALALVSELTEHTRAHALQLGARSVLARTTPPADIMDAVAQMVRTTDLGGMNVLLLTTDAKVSRATTFALTAHGVRARTVANRTELERAVLAEPPDLVIVDDPSEAWSLCRDLRNDTHTLATPVVVVVDNTDRSTLIDLLEAGAVGYIEKPVQTSQIRDRVPRELERVRARSIPVSPQEPETPQTSQRTADGVMTPATPALSHVDIVLVEDDEALAPLLAHSFDSRGFRNVLFRSGSVARSALTGDPAEVHGKVVVLDWDLPGANGLNVLQALATSGKLSTTKVLMLTGRSNENDVLRALELGASDHVTKPFSVAVLMQRIEYLLDNATSPP
jgi:DNA-binding response OmpR family regulator/HPt (histidine-containing phosphotransfer) domain-containing protein